MIKTFTILNFLFIFSQNESAFIDLIEYIKLNIKFNQFKIIKFDVKQKGYIENKNLYFILIFLF